MCRQKSLLVLCIFAVVALFSCYRTSQISMKTIKSEEVGLGLRGTGTAVINWGDGTPKETITLSISGTSHYHTYNDSTPHSITIIGGNVTFLHCGENQLTALDVSKNPELKELICFFNHLTALDVSKNTALTELYCYCNQLTTLDVSKNIALQSLGCDSNQLTTLDVSKNTALTELYCYGNQLTALDVSKNTALIYLSILSNKFDAAALNYTFGTLNVNTIKEYTKTIFISDNPGTSSCNLSIAIDKGWEVYKETE